jgi:hypothetical protein
MVSTRNCYGLHAWVSNSHIREEKPHSSSECWYFRGLLITASVLCSGTETTESMRNIMVGNTGMNKLINKTCSWDFFLGGGGVEWNRAHCYWGHYWPTVPPPGDGWWWVWSSRWNDWQGETEVLGQNPPQCCFVLHKSHMMWPGPPRGEAGD